MMGNVLVAINPWKNLQIYEEKDIDNYWANAITEVLDPHVFDIAAKSMNQMITNNVNQAIIVKFCLNL